MRFYEAKGFFRTIIIRVMAVRLGSPQVFQNRKEAGKLLAEALGKINLDLSKGLVLGLPRGGVVVAAEAAKDLKLPLDVMVTRKIGAPQNAEFALAAVDEDGKLTTDPSYEKEYHDYLLAAAEKERKEIKRRLLEYRGLDKHPQVKDRELILIDDGIATGQTMISAIRFSRNHGAKKVYVAVPVLPADTVEGIAGEANGLFYLYAPEAFWAVGQFYADFPQVMDEEVVAILNGQDK